MDPTTAPPDAAPPGTEPPTVQAEPCPDPGCADRFACDACLDEHLRRAHGASYGGLFGPAQAGLVVLCERHRDLPAGRLEA